jgi:hypothetical protein
LLFDYEFSAMPGQILTFVCNGNAYVFVRVPELDEIPIRQPESHLRSQPARRKSDRLPPSKPRNGNVSSPSTGACLLALGEQGFQALDQRWM